MVNLKKKLFIVIFIILSVIVFIIFFKPAIYDDAHITIESTWLIQNEFHEEKIKKELIAGIRDDFREYRYVYITYSMRYLSPFNITSLVSYVDVEKNDSLILANEYGGFLEGETVPANRFKKEIYGTRILIYVGDCKNDLQIRKKAMSVLNDARIRVRYNIQWIGVREDSFKINSEKASIEFFDYN